MKVFKNLLFVVRNGEAVGPRLSDVGKGQMRACAELINDYFDDRHKVVILSSPMERAAESAAVLVSRLYTPPCLKHQELNQDFSHFDEVLGLVEGLRKDYHVIILVTHAVQTSKFPQYFAKHVFHSSYQTRVMGRGEMTVIDLKKKTLDTVTYWKPEKKQKAATA